MNKTFVVISLTLVVIAVIAVSALKLWPINPITTQPIINLPNATAIPSPLTTGNGNQEDKKQLIVVYEPSENAIISSPLVVKGEARGNWYFEAVFPIRLIDSTGKELGHSIATAQGEWMTENFVPFTSTLTFNAPSDGQGTLILEKSNPSGLAENAQELRISVSWKAISARNVQLFYYNKTNDPTTTCDPAAVLPISRNIPSTQTPIHDTIKLLLQGQLTNAEVAQGFDTEFPLSGVELRGADVKDGVLTLEFTDPQRRTSGGSCRAGLLWSQIEKTARQFEGVREVRFFPEDLFQP